MDECKLRMIAEIDEALECKTRLDPCHCQSVNGSHYECDGCRIKRVLQMSRVCVIQGANELSLMQLKFIGFQDEIVAKLKEIVRTGGNGDGPAGFQEEDE